MATQEILLHPYISFNGRCEEALNFYKDVFGGEIVSLNRFGGSPMEIPEEQKDKVMHAVFSFAGNSFMASDGMEELSQQPGRISLSLGLKDKEKAEAVFMALSDGGSVTMEFQHTFWNAHFGMCVDKFGIHWLVNAD